MLESNPDIVVVGELNIDLVLWNVAMPEYEKELLAEDMRFAMGSSSAITAHNLAALGCPVGFIGVAGEDNFGNYMVSQLQGAGVDTTRIRRDPALKTGATIVLANPPKKALLTYLGAMTDLTIEDIDWDYLGRARHLHLGCFFLQSGIRNDVGKLFERAKAMGLSTSLDTNWDPEDRWGEDVQRALRHTDIFLPNEEEAMRIAGAEDVATALERLGSIVATVVIKRGAAGAVASSAGQRFEAGGIPAEVVETTGAGDSFNAGFLSRFIAGDDLVTCMRRGNACGALAVSEMGGTGAFRDREHVARYLQGVEHE